MLPQLATAIESAGLIEEVRKKLLETVGALARSMEAKDYYTGGHTERVSTSPSRSPTPRLRRAKSSTRSRSAPSCTTSARSASRSASSTSRARSTTRSGSVMKEHPVISEYILQEVDLTRSCSRSPARATSAWTARATRTAWRATDPAAGAHRPRRGCLRRADERPPVPLAAARSRQRWRSCAPTPAASSARR